MRSEILKHGHESVKPMTEDQKIVVDDDWKSQVEKEKENLGNQPKPEPDAEPQADLPEASFAMLVTTLAMQAGASLGQIPDPVSGKPKLNKPVAKHFIDTLALLELKTKGNLDKEESEILTSTVHQLRMAFINMPDSFPEETDPGPEPASPEKSTIELP